MQCFHHFYASSNPNTYPRITDDISILTNETAEPADVGKGKEKSSRPRRNTVGSCSAAEESFSSSSDDSFNKSHLAQRRSKSWYGGLIESIKSNVKGSTDVDLLRPPSRRESKSTRMKRALDDIIRWCPEEHCTELITNHVQLIRQKIEDKNVTIGICGEPESGRRTLLNVLQHSKNHIISSTDTPIVFKLCPFVDTPQVGNDLSQQFKHSLLSCSAYLFVLSCEELNDCKICTQLLEILLQRDKDIFNQKRALIIANKLDICFPTPTTCTAASEETQLPRGVIKRDHSLATLSISSTNTSEYSHYDRFNDHEDFEKFVRQKLCSHIKHYTNIEIPKQCIIPSMLKWSQLSRDYCQGIEEGSQVEQQLQEWLDLHEPYRTMNIEVETMSNEELFEVITGVAKIEAWVEEHAENIKILKELSILSDIIHCIHYTIDKLQNNIDTTTIKIENLESLQVQKSQLFDDLNRLYKCVSSYKNDAGLFNSLKVAYDRDIKDPLENIRKLAQNLIDRFQEMSITKLNRLIHCNFEHMSVEALQETCELDIASFSRGATNKLKSVLKTVVFRNMHNILPFNDIKENSQELTKLAEHLLKEQTSLEMNYCTGGLEDQHRVCLSFLHEDYYSRMSCTSGLELYYPVTLDAVNEGEADSLQVMSSELHPCFYSMLHFHSATISSTFDSPTEEQEPIKHRHLGDEIKNNFITHCERYLTSDSLKRKAVQFHMDIVSNYICNFLDKFEKKYNHQLEGMKLQMNEEIESLKRLRENDEVNLKRVITLKVDMELRRAELLSRQV